MRRNLILLAAFALAGVTLARCSPTYVLRAGIEEARILARRQPIERVIVRPGTDHEAARKLRLVLDARTFAGKVLGLDVGGSYSTYSAIDRDTLALVLSASRRDRFEPVTWWFPIVGRFPYKGFFSADDALDAARDLERRGFDTYVRTTSAFSTLGWFDDPLLSTVLRYDDVALVSTVIHELAHNTLFIPGQVPFNETFASFVGDRGAIAFFCALEGDNGPRCRQARDEWHDHLLFADFISGLIAELETLYARNLPLDHVLSARESIFETARGRFRDEVQPRLRTPAYAAVDRLPLDNARLIAIRVYNDRLHLFEQLFHTHAGDLAATIRALKAATPDLPDPFTALTPGPATP